MQMEETASSSGELEIVPQPGGIIALYWSIRVGVELLRIDRAEKAFLGSLFHRQLWSTINHRIKNILPLLVEPTEAE